MGEIFRWVNLPDFRQALQRMGDAAGDAVGDAALAGAGVMLKHTQRNIRDRGLIDTSNYVNSWYLTLLEKTQSRAEAASCTDVIYGPTHEWGAIIRPRHAKALCFQTKDGNWVIVQSVTIPARPHVRPAVDEHVPEIEAMVVGVLKRAIEGAMR